jgi:transposase InsO family protein
MKIGEHVIVLQASGLDQAKPTDRPRLVSDNDSSHVAGEWPNGLMSIRSSTFAARPYHPMTQGKIEGWHQTLKNRILLETTSWPVMSKPDRGLSRRLQSTPLA